MGCECTGVDVVGADGGLVHIRTVAAKDLAGLRALHAQASARPINLQFNLGRLPTENGLVRLLAPSNRDHHTVLACVRGRIVGVPRSSGSPILRVPIGPNSRS